MYILSSDAIYNITEALIRDDFSDLIHEYHQTNTLFSQNVYIFKPITFLDNPSLY